MIQGRLRGVMSFLALALIAAAAAAAPKPLEMNESRSLFYAVLRPTGIVGRATGVHVVEGRDWRTDFCYDPGEPTSLRGEIVVRAPSIEVDTARARAAEGLGSPPPDAIISMLANEIRGPRGIDVNTYPTIRFDVQEVRERPAGGYLLVGPLTFHGQTRRVEVPARINPLSGDAVEIDARLTLNQREYGVKPLSIPGVLTVEDDLDFRIEIRGTPGEGTCKAE